MNQSRASYTYRLMFVAFIVWVSSRTLLSAPQLAASGHAGLHFIYALAGTEIIAALGFLIIPIQRWSGALLLLIFAVAGLHQIIAGEVPASLLFYASTVIWLLYLESHPKDRT